MYGIFPYIWVIFGANDDKYSIHGAYGKCVNSFLNQIVSGDGSSKQLQKKVPQIPGEVGFYRTLSKSNLYLTTYRGHGFMRTIGFEEKVMNITRGHHLQG